MAGMKRSNAGRVAPRKRARRAMVSRSVPRSVPTAKFVRTFWAENWPFSPIAVSGFWKNVAPSFQQLPDILQFTDMFDTFRVDRIKITLIPRWGETDATFNGTTAQIQNKVYLSIGMDNLNTEVPAGTYSSTTYNTFAERTQNIRIVDFSKPVSYSFKPNIRNSLNVGNSIIPCPFISTTTAATQALLGSSLFLHDANFTNLNGLGFSADIFYTYTFTCKGQR